MITGSTKHLLFKQIAQVLVDIDGHLNFEEMYDTIT